MLKRAYRADKRQIQENLRGMTNRLEDLAAHTEQTVAYSTAITAVHQSLKSILLPPTTSTKLPSIQQPQKPTRPLILRSDLSGPKDPALELLRYYGIRIPTSSLNSPTDLATALQSELNERVERQQNLAEATEQSISTQVAESVDAADAQLETLLKAVYAYSPFASVRLADASTLERIERLERDIAGVGEKMGRLDVEALVLAERRSLDDVLGAGVADS